MSTDSLYTGRKVVLLGDEARAGLVAGLSLLAGAVACTLGPKGKCVLIQSQEAGPLVTKDGVSVARSISLRDPAMRAGADLIREASQRTADVAGDGTTTATVLAHAMVIEGLAAINKKSNPVSVKKGIDIAVDAVVAELKRSSRNIDAEHLLKQVATISANGDEAIGLLIAQAVKKMGDAGVITVEEARGSTSTTLEFVEGLQFGCGWMNSYFATNTDKMVAELPNPLVLLCDQRVSTSSDLRPALEAAHKSGRPLLIIAEDVEGEALQTLIVNKVKGLLQICAVKAPGWGTARAELLNDMAILTGARVVSPATGLKITDVRLEHMGSAERSTSDKATTTIVGDGKTVDAISGRVTELRERLAVPSLTSEERSQLIERIGKLSAGAAVIRVGGLTEVEVRERKDRVDDAVCATRAALEEGIVPGGGTALARASGCLAEIISSETNRDIRTGCEIVRAACLAPIRQIASNAGVSPDVVSERSLHPANAPFWGWDAASGDWRDLGEAGIIDPTKVTRTALQHAASVAGVFLTLDAVVLDEV